MEPEDGNQFSVRRPGESEDQMSVAEFGLRPQDSFMSSLPKMLLSQPLVESKTLAKQYEALSRLSISLASMTLEDLSRNLAALLRPLLDFDFLDVIVFKQGTSEVLWHSVGAGQFARQMFRSKKRLFGGFTGNSSHYALRTGGSMIGSQCGERH